MFLQLNRTALHYAYGVSDTCGDSYITELIHIDSRNTTTTDVVCRSVLLQLKHLNTCYNEIIISNCLNIALCLDKLTFI